MIREFRRLRRGAYDVIGHERPDHGAGARAGAETDRPGSSPSSDGTPIATMRWPSSLGEGLIAGGTMKRVGKTALSRRRSDTGSGPPVSSFEPMHRREGRDPKDEIPSALQQR